MNARVCAGVNILCLGLAAAAFAQSKLDLSMPDLLNLSQQSKTVNRTALDTRPVAMDAPLDPTEYTVGPGDILALNIWSSSPADYQLQVTPEGYVLVPNVGAVNLRDLSLDEARKKAIPLIQKKYPSAEISLTLLTPRKISVQISGQVMNEGMLEMSSVQRVDHLISAGNMLAPTQMTRDFYFYDIPRLKRDASQRNIVIHRRDGTTRHVDLIKFAMTGRSVYDPYLREGDVVYVPLRKYEDNNVGALGAFVGPTSVEFAEGDSVTDLVMMGFGLKATADTTHAVLARETLGGGMDTVRFDLRAVLEHRAPNIAIRPGDRLHVPDNPDPRQGDYITLEGAVVHPGRYPITANTSFIRDVIRAAGGFTVDANPAASTLTRGRPYETNVPEEIQHEQLMSTRTAIIPQDSSYYLTETALRLKGELVSVNFRKLFIDSDSTCDVTLRNYDHLIIATKQRTVYVFGQVLQPGHVPYAPGKGYRYYVEKANGYTADARSGDVKVIKAGTRVWLDPGETEIEDGDFIWVPKDYHYPFGYYLTTAFQIAGIVGTLATLIILTRTIK